jgi:RNA polymerase sigma-70 factor, ECF subfamily
MKDQSADDLAMVHKVVAGDSVALGMLYARYGDPLYAYVFHRLHGNRQDAEDVWHETWLAAMRALPGFRGDSRLFTWLCGIARHKVADLYRRRGATEITFSDISPASLEDILSGQLPEDALQRSADLALMIEAVETLPDDYRQALIARYAEGLPVDRVALVLRKSYKATESLLSRARAALRQALQELDEEQHER